MTKRIPPSRSLNTKVVLLLVVSLLCGTLLYALFNATGHFLVSRFYMSPEAVYARRLEAFGDFKEYVLENQLSSRNSTKIGEWTISRQYVTIVIRSAYTRVEAGKWGASTSELPVGGEKTFPELTGEGIFYLRFTDGIFQVSVSENSQSRQNSISTVLAVVLASLCVVLSTFVYMHRVTRRITKLVQSAQEIEKGNFENEITARGNDEIAMLAREMDDMRKAVIVRIESERQAWQSNSSLLTAISHDLRTPMTAMIGYLELLKNGEYEDEAQRDRFTLNAHGKAMELKELTDELFKYFQLFGSNKIPMTPEAYDAEILLEQLIGETAIQLRESGYNVRQISFHGSFTIFVDALSLKRIFDNMFSNIKKYADKKRPVVIMTELVDDKSICICISNSTLRDTGKVESTKIGLQTCVKIAEQMGGSFKTVSDQDHFLAELTLPVVKQTPPEK